MDQNTQHEVTPTPTQLAADTVTKPTPKRIRKPAPKAPVVDYKKMATQLERECQILIEELDGQRQKNAILFKQMQDVKQKLSDMEQQQAMAINQITQKLQMLGNDVIIMLK